MLLVIFKTFLNVYFLTLKTFTTFFHILASLLHAYDSSWQVEAYPSLIGSNHFSNIKENDQTTFNAPKKDISTLRRYWRWDTKVPFFLGRLEIRMVSFVYTYVK